MAPKKNNKGKSKKKNSQQQQQQSASDTPAPPSPASPAPEAGPDASAEPQPDSVPEPSTEPPAAAEGQPPSSEPPESQPAAPDEKTKQAEPTPETSTPPPEQQSSDVQDSAPAPAPEESQEPESVAAQQPEIKDTEQPVTDNAEPPAAESAEPSATEGAEAPTTEGAGPSTTENSEPPVAENPPAVPPNQGTADPEPNFTDDNNNDQGEAKDLSTERTAAPESENTEEKSKAPEAHTDDAAATVDRPPSPTADANHSAQDTYPPISPTLSASRQKSSPAPQALEPQSPTSPRLVHPTPRTPPMAPMSPISHRSPTLHARPISPYSQPYHYRAASRASSARTNGDRRVSPSAVRDLKEGVIPDSIRLLGINGDLAANAKEEDVSDLLSRIQTAIPDIVRLVGNYYEIQQQLSAQEAEHRQIEEQHEQALKHKDYYIEKIKDQMTKAAQESETECSRLKAEADVLRKQMSAYQERLRDIEQSLTEMQTTNEGLSKAKDKLQGEVSALQQQLEEATTMHEQERQQQDSVHAESLSRQKDDLIAQYEEIKANDTRVAVEQLKTTLESDFSKERDSFQADSESKQQKISELTAESERQLANHKEQSESEKTELMKSKELVSADYEERLNAKQIDLDTKQVELEKKNDDFEAKSAEVEQKQAALDSKQSELDAKIEELNAASSEIEQKHNQIDSMNAEIDALKNDLDAKHTELQSKLSELNEKENEIDSVKKHMEEKLAELALVQERVDTQEQDLETRKSELEQTQAELSTAKEELQGKVTEFTSLQERVESQERDIGSWKAELDSKIAELEKIQDELSMEKQKVEANLSELATLQEQVNSQGHEIESRQMKLESQEAELSGMKDSLEAKHAELSSIQEPFEQQQAQLESKNSELTTIESELESKHSELAALQANLDEHQKSHAEEIESLKALHEDKTKAAAQEAEEHLNELATQFGKKEEEWRASQPSQDDQLRQKTKELDTAIKTQKALEAEILAEKERSRASERRLEETKKEMWEMHKNVAADCERLKKRLQSLGEATELKVNGDKFFIERFDELYRLIARVSRENSVHLPLDPPANVIAKIPVGVPHFFDNTPASRELRSAYIQHIIYSILTARVFQPFLFTLGKHDGIADSIFQTLSADIRRKSVRREALWRQQTLKAAYTTANAKQAINAAANDVYDEILSQVRPFTDPPRIDALRQGIRRVVKVAAETWRQARVERGFIVASMPPVGDEEGGGEGWAEFSYGAEDAGGPSGLPQGPTRARERVLIRTAPRIVREAVYDDFTQMTPAEGDPNGPCLYLRGTALFADSRAVVVRRDELARVRHATASAYRSASQSRRSQSRGSRDGVLDGFVHARRPSAGTARMWP